MKNSIKISAVFFFVLCFCTLNSQSDSLGLPGDNLDLKAVLAIFKQSSSVEEFERKLNAADSKVNNLDLNNDHQVDYLRVVDSGKDDFHSIVIQAPISKSESQDVAVIEVEKKGDKVAHIQIVGDETLYGKDYIIEPQDEALAKSANKKEEKGYNDDVYNTSTYEAPPPQAMVNVWGWPAVSYMYAPGYSFWVSPWYWGYYPTWYSPWAPYGWYYYHRGFIGWNYGFYGYRSSVYASPRAHSYYYGRRTSSGYVNKTAPHYGRGHNMNGNQRGRTERGGWNRGSERINHSGDRGGGRMRNGGGQDGGGGRMRRGGGPDGGTRMSPGGNGGGNRGGGNGGGSGGRMGGGGGNGGGGGGRMSGGGGHHR